MASGGPSMDALLYEAARQGVLPITSQCAMGCVFCSNRHNPPSVEILDVGRRSFEDIARTLPWLQAGRGPILIGESVTRISEGEPLTHPSFAEILRLVRREYPKKTVSVTTGGSLLSSGYVDVLEEVGAEVTLSLNTVGYRKEVMGDPDSDRTLSRVSSLKGRVQFEGSIVALPFVTGYKDIEDSVGFLAEAGALTVRLLLPGFSACHPLWKEMPKGQWDDLRRFADELKSGGTIPILVDPPGLRDLKATIEAVLPGSPASRAGLAKGDVVTHINGKEVFSRKDTFMKAYAMENPKVTFLRGGLGDPVSVALAKGRGSAPGFVMYDDLDLDDYLAWERVSGIAKGRDVLILTSAPAVPLIKAALARRGHLARIKTVRSRVFGGNIQVAGLLTVSDMLAAYKQVGGPPPFSVTIPAKAFDPWGRDVEGVHYRAFAQSVGLPVVLAG